VLGQRRPQRGRLAQPARPQLQPHERGERLFRRPTGAAPTAERLGEADDIGQPVSGGPVDDVADPALDQGEGRLQPSQRGLLLRAVLRGEHALQRDLLHALRVGRIEAVHRLLDRFPVDPDTGRIGFDRGEHVPAQPRHMPEQPLVGGLA
jgi:hypothetical protein